MNYSYIKDGDLDAYLFHEGTFYRSYEFLGCHKTKEGVRFVVWAPWAKEAYLIGDFNQWNSTSLALKRIGNSGLWNIVVKGVNEYDAYKYRIISMEGEERIKADPYAFHAETRPLTASKYFDLKGFSWSDKGWLEKREANFHKPLSIYELNPMSWKRKEDGSPLSYRELGDTLVKYVKSMGYTHIELMPIMEHPYDGSWGYQVTGYFAPTSRYGTPKDFMYFVDKCHSQGIGIILDWVPVHFTRDDFGLARFDGSYLFVAYDQALAVNDQWGTLNFDFSKPEVLSFLISNALYWFDYYHIDGLRIDAVAYMLYLDFGGKDLKNKYGGRENLEAIDFIKKLNEIVFKNYPDVMMIAEESTAWPLVTYPIDKGGLGFNYKWNMGWMNDILEYMETDPYFRKGKQNALTFSITYCFSENFILPFSHDEVVHGKKSLLNKMPGTYEEKFSNLRLLYLYMYAHPGKKLNFMGSEYGQFIEWNEWKELDWFLLEYDLHQKMQVFVKELNKLYREESCLYELDNTYDGFDWIDHTNHQESIIAFERINIMGQRIIGIFNFTPVRRDSYPIGVGEKGTYKTLINTDHKRYGGDLPRIKSYKTLEEPIHGREYRINVDLPPLGGIYLKLRGD